MLKKVLKSSNHYRTKNYFCSPKQHCYMNTTKTIQSALISVFSKDGLEPIVRKLHEQNVILYSTGGTEDFIKNIGIPVVAVEDVTSYPSILGGRVNTLHPKIFGCNVFTLPPRIDG